MGHYVHAELLYYPTNGGMFGEDSKWLGWMKIIINQPRMAVAVQVATSIRGWIDGRKYCSYVSLMFAKALTLGAGVLGSPRSSRDFDSPSHWLETF